MASHIVDSIHRRSASHNNTDFIPSIERKVNAKIVLLWTQVRSGSSFSVDLLSSIPQTFTTSEPRSSNHLLKVVTLNLSVALEIIENNRNLDIRIIHLVRDPRGIIQSSHYLQFDNFPHSAEFFCARLRSDMEAGNWRLIYTFPEVLEIQSKCSDVILRLQYRLFQNDEQYRNLSYSVLH
ncbi:uncharacterized protein LOC125178338 [Hyalella azteca]|uniref:Uncharacterized protein LOC125178338 n=1 Tax=Hyalella azteca TaxID=294128 RepID=A0A979FMR5_HYAAZ|nr:uncharacterized protein LOC125178338 [Hyalella azteca]